MAAHRVHIGAVGVIGPNPHSREPEDARPARPARVGQEARGVPHRLEDSRGRSLPWRGTCRVARLVRHAPAEDLVGRTVAHDQPRIGRPIEVRHAGAVAAAEEEGLQAQPAVRRRPPGRTCRYDLRAGRPRALEWRVRVEHRH